MGKIKKTYICAVDATIDLIGGKYKAVVLWHLMGKTLRYSEIQRIFPSATPKMITQQLRELERDALITRTVYPVVPPKVEYSLSELGKSIEPVLNGMCNWGESYLERIGLSSCIIKS